MARLIDADELKKDDEVIQWLSLNAVRTGKTLKLFSELFVKKIDDAPTVQAIPFSVLKDIRRDIANMSRFSGDSYFMAKQDACDVIDKYIKEYT